MSNIQINFAIFLVLFSWCKFLLAEEYSVINAVELAEKKQLHLKKDWQHLMQYISRAWSGSQSLIKSEHSFFAEDGYRNPERELYETLIAMLDSPSQYSSVNEHPRCKFIARYHFLSEYIEFPDDIKNLRCQEFEKWLNTEKIDSISLIFASGYFKNPASFYGHPLLKFNSTKDNKSSLLDITISNGAVVPEGENPVSYVIKGLFGGYQAAFSDTKFYQLNHNYSETDLRDLWEYELDLSDEQIKRVAYYSWELLGQRFTYRFLNKNCGYFLEDLLQYALGERITPRQILYTLPAATFFNVIDARVDGKPLVKKISRTASRHNRFYEKYIALSELEKKTVKKFVKDSSLPFSDLPEKSQLKIINTLIDYYAFIESKTEKEEKRRSYQLLSLACMQNAYRLRNSVLIGLRILLRHPHIQVQDQV